MTYPCLDQSTWGHLCNRPQGHVGQHVALGPYNRVAAAWDARRLRVFPINPFLCLHENPAPDLSPPKDPPLKIVG